MKITRLSEIMNLLSYCWDTSNTDAVEIQTYNPKLIFFRQTPPYRKYLKVNPTGFRYFVTQIILQTIFNHQLTILISSVCSTKSRTRCLSFHKKKTFILAISLFNRRADCIRIFGLPISYTLQHFNSNGYKKNIKENVHHISVFILFNQQVVKTTMIVKVNYFSFDENQHEEQLQIFVTVNQNSAISECYFQVFFYYKKR